MDERNCYCRWYSFTCDPGTNVTRMEATETPIKQYLRALFYLQREQSSEHIGRSRYSLESSLS